MGIDWENKLSETNALIKLRDVHFSRGSKLIFDGVDMDIQRGKVTAIMGPSGTGKTTLLKLIGGQLKPSSGFIEVDGQNVHQLKHKQLYQLRKKWGCYFKVAHY